MRVLDKTILTMDEEYDPNCRVANVIREHLKTVPMDPYNKTYVVRVTVDEVDEAPPEEE